MMMRSPENKNRTKPKEKDERDGISHLEKISKDDDKRSNYMYSRSLCMLCMHCCTFNPDISYWYRQCDVLLFGVLTHTLFFFATVVHKAPTKLLVKETIIICMIVRVLMIIRSLRKSKQKTLNFLPFARTSQLMLYI